MFDIINFLMGLITNIFTILYSLIPFYIAIFTMGMLSGWVWTPIYKILNVWK